MNYQDFAEKKFQEIVREAPANNCSVLIHENGVLIDAGCDCPGGWMAAKYALEGLTGGRGQVSYAQRQVGDVQMPAVELFLDDPVGAAVSFAPDENGLFGVPAQRGYGLGISLAGMDAAKRGVGNLIAAKHNSLFASLLEAGSLIARAVNALQAQGIQEIQWAWSSCPLTAMVDDVQESSKRRGETSARYGAVSVWVRGEVEQIRHVVNDFTGAPLCVHELATACTYQKRSAADV